jgi:hypothetical protein
MLQLLLRPLTRGFDKTVQKRRGFRIRGVWFLRGRSPLPCGVRREFVKPADERKQARTCAVEKSGVRELREDDSADIEAPRCPARQGLSLFGESWLWECSGL